MVKQIPNLITSLNLLCGSVAILFAAAGDTITAAFFIFFGIFFDFFDGLAARLLKAQSDVGLEFDSIADVITSGVAPAIVMVQMLSEAFLGGPYDLLAIFGSEGWNSYWTQWMPLTGLLIAVGAGYRLAKFNVDTRQTSQFIGLPTPANTLLVLSLPLMLYYQESELLARIILNPWFLVGMTLLCCWLMNCEIRLFALKFSTWDFGSNKQRYIFLMAALILLLTLKFAGIPALLLLYILMSVFWKEKA